MEVKLNDNDISNAIMEHFRQCLEGDTMITKNLNLLYILIYVGRKEFQDIKVVFSKGHLGKILNN